MPVLMQINCTFDNKQVYAFTFSRPLSAKRSSTGSTNSRGKTNGVEMVVLRTSLPLPQVGLLLPQAALRAGSQPPALSAASRLQSVPLGSAPLLSPAEPHFPRTLAVGIHGQDDVGRQKLGSGTSPHTPHLSPACAYCHK